MPTSTFHSSSDDPGCAHVPVDKFYIVNGPSSARCRQLLEQLRQLAQTSDEPYVEQLFTLHTLASSTSFRRRLRLVGAYSLDHDGAFTFTALFSGSRVSGLYTPGARKGWFSFD